MSTLTRTLTRSTLPLLLVLCLAALSASYAYADGALSPLATQVIGDPDAAVTGKFAVGTATPGNKALTVVGVIDFLGSGTVHNYFTQGAGNNMQINTNVDEANTVGDASRSQWKLVMGSSLDWFSIRRSPVGGTYNEDALFFIDGSTGNVGIATVDTGNGATISFTPMAKLHAETSSGDGIWGVTTSTSSGYGVYGRSYGSSGYGVYGVASATTGTNNGVFGRTDSTAGRGVSGWAISTTGATRGVYGRSDSPSGVGVYGEVPTTTGYTVGVSGYVTSPSGVGVLGEAYTPDGDNIGVYGKSHSSSGVGVFGWVPASGGTTYGVMGDNNSTSGAGVSGHAWASTGTSYGVYGRTDSPSGYGVYFVGGLAGTGTKSAIVETEDYGWRSLYAVESPQNWFEDFGQATLVAGEAVVPIESVFAQTVNLDKPYHVFLTPRGGFCSLYVAETSSSSFTVRAVEGSDCEITFDYRIIAARLEYEDLRLKPAEDPEAVAAGAALAREP